MDLLFYSIVVIIVCVVSLCPVCRVHFVFVCDDDISPEASLSALA